MIKKIDLECYVFTTDNEWKVTQFEIEQISTMDEVLIEASLFLAEIVSSPEILFALLFQINKNRVKPILYAYASLAEKGTVVEQLQTAVGNKWSNKLDTNKLFEIMQAELLAECPEAINGHNLEYLLEEVK